MSNTAREREREREKEREACLSYVVISCSAISLFLSEEKEFPFAEEDSLCQANEKHD